MKPLELSNKEKWLLSIIGAVPYIHGDTRLQKYALLVSKQILGSREFFDDWKAGNYGGFSRSVTICVNKLVKGGLVDSQEFTYDHDKKVRRYSISSNGKSIMDEFIKKQSEVFKKIVEMLGYYHPKRLKELLDNVYVLYPYLTTKSKIKAEVNKSILKSNSFLSTEYEIAIDGKEPLEIFSPAPVNEHIFGDDYFREKLAKSIGLSRPPKLDPKSFKRLSGIISSKIETDEFDSVELVKAVRGC